MRFDAKISMEIDKESGTCSFSVFDGEKGMVYWSRRLDAAIEEFHNIADVIGSKSLSVKDWPCIMMIVGGEVHKIGNIDGKKWYKIAQLPT